MCLKKRISLLKRGELPEPKVKKPTGNGTTTFIVQICYIIEIFIIRHGKHGILHILIHSVFVYSINVQHIAYRIYLKSKIKTRIQ